HAARRANEHARRKVAVGKVRAARMIPGRTGIARRKYPARLAAEQGVHRHALASRVSPHAPAHLDDLSDVLVAQHEGKRGERRRRRAGLERDDVQVAAADSSHARPDAHPFVTRQLWLGHVTVSRAGVRPEVPRIRKRAGDARGEIGGNGRGEPDGLHAGVIPIAGVVAVAALASVAALTAVAAVTAAAGVTTRSARGTQDTSRTAERARLYSPSVSYAGGSAKASRNEGACSIRTSGSATCVPLVADAKSFMRRNGDATAMETASSCPSVTLAAGAMRNAPSKFFPLATISMRCRRSAPSPCAGVVTPAVIP